MCSSKNRWLSRLTIARRLWPKRKSAVSIWPSATNSTVVPVGRDQTHHRKGNDWATTVRPGRIASKAYRLGASGWRYDQNRVGSWVLEEPIHFFDLARWYLESSGDPIELVAYGNSRDPARPQLFDNFSAMFRYANGSYAVVSQTLAAFEHHQTVKVSGTRGALWAGWSGALDRTLEPTSFLKVFDGEQLREVELPG